MEWGRDEYTADSQMARNWFAQQRVLKKGAFWGKSLGYLHKAADNSLKHAQKDWTAEGNNELSYAPQVWSTAAKKKKKKEKKIYQLGLSNPGTAPVSESPKWRGGESYL